MKMTITDKTVKKALATIHCPQLTDNVKTFPDDEIDGKTEFDIFKNELSYLWECYHENGHIIHDELADAKRLLKETENGKIRPLDNATLKPKHGYTDNDILIAKNIVNEFNRVSHAVAKYL